MNSKFLYGVSSSAYQIEGAYNEDGKGLSVWDNYSKIEGKIYKGQNADVSTDHYHRYKEDVALMKQLGINAYRFSISWPRVLPNGIGQVNPKGIEFYEKLIKELLANGILPVITFYHWDLPQALEDKDGIMNPDFPKWFLEYTKVIIDNFGKYTNMFITFNEPINVVHSSYYSGVFAPGRKVGEANTLRGIINMLKAHGLAANYIHEHVKDAQVSMAFSTFEEYPMNMNDKCIEAAKKRFFTKPIIGECIDVYLDPLCLGKFPQHCYDRFPEVMKEVTEEDMKIIASGTNVICYNNYSGYPIDEDGNEVKQDAPFYCVTGKPFNPNGLEWNIRFLVERYHLPIYISENGIACEERIGEDGEVNDQNRCTLISIMNDSVDKLIKEGFDIRGYFVWSFTDNFEWLSGFKMRFGLVYIDYDNNLKRIPKNSFYTYKDVIAKHLK